MSVANEIDLERERIQCVFGLGGGELHVADDRWPDEWDGPNGIAYWYDGVPEYATELKDADEVECPTCQGTGEDDGEDCSACDGPGHRDREVRTAIIQCLFGYPEPPTGWERIASFTSSGEAECWWCGDGTGNEDARDECQLCEGDGLLYLGEGYAEVIFRRTVSR